MSFNVGGTASQQGNMVGSNYIVNIVELQNVITSATGLSPLQQVQNQVAQLETMVNFDQKRIFTNIISKFDQTPIQITDDINLSNANIFQNGILFSGGGTTTGGNTVLSSGGSAIILTNTSSIFSTAMAFQVGGRTVFSFDGAGRALYFDPQGTGDRFWVSSATLVADQVQFGGAGLGAQPGKFLQCISTSGTATWNYVSSLFTTDGNAVTLSSGGIFFNAGIGSALDAGRIDSRRNWYLGNPSLTGNNDLTTSNDFTVIGGKLRYQGGGTPVVGQVLTIADALGNVVLSNSGGGSLSSFVVGDQIQSGSTSVRADGAGQYVAVTQGFSEVARFTGSGRLGINNPAPTEALDVTGNARVSGSLTVAPGTSQTDYVLRATGTGGTGTWAEPQRLFTGSGATLQEWKVNSALAAVQGSFNGAEQLRFSTGGAYVGVTNPYNWIVNGTVTASTFASLSPIRFNIGATNTEVGRFADNGNFGIGTSNPLYKLHVAGTQSNQGALYVSTNGWVYGTLTAGFFSGDGSNITNIQTQNVGTGSNRLDTFQGQTRADILTLQRGISTLSTATFSTIESYNLAGGLSFYSTLSSYLTQTSNSLSAAIGPGAGAVVSSYSTQVGLAMSAQFSTLSSYILLNEAQISTFSTMMSTTAYATTSSFVSSLLSTGAVFTGPLWASTLGVGYKYGIDVSGTIDTNGLIYSAGLRGLSTPFTLGVGTSTTLSLIGYSYTPNLGWRMSLQGDVDISGQLYRNGQLYTVQGEPDVYWSRNGSNIWFADGNVGIGLTTPQYPLDVYGRIRCFGVDVIPGPGPGVSTGQAYANPWQYQGSNIYYNLGGGGIGPGLSSVSSMVSWEVSGNVLIQNGTTYMSSLAVNIPYGSTLVAGADIFASLRARSMKVDGPGVFDGRVTARDFLSLSDQRMKKNIELLSNPELIMSSIRGVRFQWISTEENDIGLLAQDVMKMIPEAVSGDLESGLKVSYDKLIPVLVEAIKQLQTRVETLEKQVKNL